MKSVIFELMNDKLIEICKKWGINELLFFGSVLTDKFNKESDIDIIISIKDEYNYGLFEFIDIKKDFENVFGREIDLLTKDSIMKSKNYFRKNSILNNSRLIYAER